MIGHFAAIDHGRWSAEQLQSEHPSIGVAVRDEVVSTIM
jgi:hypothetical protein